ncbi:MAG: hypothetical protein OZSIB_0001 [Candidatus Ozemobacter sibiricus]|uniref:Uncharacterized protein n=1 Tax=Candidatus Ozemobacter sibiricus TaxID=2268124 RepID=A0A367ZPS5_9BACT|nr:MAG: hypothetical protein OZSIB_0001 [Candidatus Ozemobacter sibiricus]
MRVGAAGGVTFSPWATVFGATGDPSCVSKVTWYVVTDWATHLA